MGWEVQRNVARAHAWSSRPAASTVDVVSLSVLLFSPSFLTVALVSCVSVEHLRAPLSCVVYTLWWSSVTCEESDGFLNFFLAVLQLY